MKGSESVKDRCPARTAVSASECHEEVIASNLHTTHKSRPCRHKTFKYIVATLLAVGSLSFILFESRGNPDLFPGDFNLRYNEISCSHDGVNPFKIWSGEISNVRYCGHPRPDIEDGAASGKLQVHSYPPWHTTFFWWYPFLPRVACVAAIRFLNVAAWLFAAVLFASRLPVKHVEDKVLACSCGMMAFGYSFACHFAMCNYGGLELWLFLLMLHALSKGRQFVAGAAWAVMMIKPQVGMLAFWPLLFSRQYKAILVATSICATATCWPAYVYGCSPLELLMQIPEIGAPYMAGAWDMSILGFPLSFAVGAATMTRLFAFIGLALCAFASWRFRNCGSLLVRFLPFLFIFPEWTYSGIGDRLLQIPLYFTLAAIALRSVHADSGGMSARIIIGCLMGLTAVEIFHFVWMAMPEFGMSHSGIGWIYRAVAKIATPAIRVALFVSTWKLVSKYDSIPCSKKAL